MDSFSFRDYTVKVEEPNSIGSLYKLFSQCFVGPDDPSGRKERRLIKRLEYSFEEPKHYVVSVYHNDTLVGSAMINDDEDIAWVGIVCIDKKYRKTFATTVLFHYILNIFFKDRGVFLGDELDDSFKKLVVVFRRFGRAIFTEEAKDRIARVIERC